MVEAPKIKVRRHLLGQFDPPGEIYTVAIESQKNGWHETHGSREQCEAFLRGFRSGWLMAGGQYLPLTQIEEVIDEIEDSDLE